MKNRRSSIRIVTSVGVLGAMLMWPGHGQVEAAPEATCTVFEDWDEVDSLWFIPLGNDPHHKHHSGDPPHQQEPSGEWVHKQNVQALGYQHTTLKDQYASDTGEHGICFFPPPTG